MGLEMGPIGSRGTTSYRLPISLTIFAVLWMFQTDGWTDEIGLAIGGTLQ